MMKTKRLAILLGDPVGIGPEIVVKALHASSAPEYLRHVVIADPGVWQQAQNIADVQISTDTIDESDLDAEPLSSKPSFLPYHTLESNDYVVGQINRKAGLSVIQTLEYALGLFDKGLIDGIAFAPFNKQSLHEAGLSFESELEYLIDRYQAKHIPGELNIASGLWALRVTSHVALKNVSQLLTEEKIYHALHFFSNCLRKSGFDNAKIAVAGLNPHNGENGRFGREELDVIAPAVQRAQQDGLNVVGPYPADTIFLRRKREGFTGLLGMYHDQIQIGLKLLGFDEGVTILGGLPLPIGTAAHGTALDIAGKNVASPNAFSHALQLLTKMLAVREEHNVKHSL